MNPFLLPFASYTSKDPIDLVWTVFDVVPLEKEHAYQSAMALLSPGQRAVFAIECYRAEVRNGGHGQFFCNSSGIVWKDALLGLELIGAVEIRKLLLSAVSCFPSGNPAMDWDQRLEQLEQFNDEVLNDFDQPFYEREQPFLDNLINRYVDEHFDEFFETEERSQD
jgi:hypothetical protein